MYSLSVRNDKGELLTLTNNPDFSILDVSGTNPPVGTINTVNIAGFDGSRFNSARAEPRNIVILLNIHPPMEENRLKLYKFFRIKQPVRVFMKNAHRDVYIDGYVETVENNPWTQLQQPQISIICPQPYWKNAKETVVNFSYSTPLFEFPFAIPAEGIEFSTREMAAVATVDVGEIDTGGIIELTAAYGNVKNPIFYNRTTQEFFGVTVDMVQGDKVIINTLRGQKSVKLVHNGTETNLIANRTDGSTWLQFVAGENEISYSADVVEQEPTADNLLVRFIVTRLFEGV